jgi:hypothetical protein
MSLSSSLKAAPDAENNLLFNNALRDGMSHAWDSVISFPSKGLKGNPYF